MSLHFELTSHGNMFCKHCYNNSGNNENLDAMTAENWIDFAKYLVERGGVFECLLSGSESFLLGYVVYKDKDIIKQILIQSLHHGKIYVKGEMLNVTHKTE